MTSNTNSIKSTLPRRTRSRRNRRQNIRRTRRHLRMYRSITRLQNSPDNRRKSRRTSSNSPTTRIRMMLIILTKLSMILPRVMNRRNIRQKSIHNRTNRRKNRRANSYRTRRTIQRMRLRRMQGNFIMLRRQIIADRRITRNDNNSRTESSSSGPSRRLQSNTRSEHRANYNRTLHNRNTLRLNRIHNPMTRTRRRTRTRGSKRPITASQINRITRTNTNPDISKATPILRTIRLNNRTKPTTRIKRASSDSQSRNHSSSRRLRSLIMSYKNRAARHSMNRRRRNKRSSNNPLNPARRNLGGRNRNMRISTNLRGHKSNRTRQCSSIHTLTRTLMRRLERQTRTKTMMRQRRRSTRRRRTQRNTSRMMISNQRASLNAIDNRARGLNNT